MKFTSIISALVLATSVAAMPSANSEIAAISARSPVPGCIKERGADEDAVNICCLKVKREAEAASEVARDLAEKVEKAQALRSALKAGTMSAIQAREAFPVPGCIKSRNADEDEVNICCLKVKREAEAAADAAVEAYKDLADMMKFRN